MNDNDTLLSSCLAISQHCTALITTKASQISVPLIVSGDHVTLRVEKVSLKQGLKCVIRIKL